MNNTFNNKVKNNYQNLTDSDKLIVDYINSNIEKAKNLTITDLSNEANVSTATISRFSQKLGYKNFQEMKMSLVMDYYKEGLNFFTSVSKGDDAITMVEDTFNTAMKSINETLKSTIPSNFNKAIEILSQANICGLFGLGGSSVVALNAYHRFMRTSLNCLHSMDYHMQLINAGKLTKDDCAIIVSHSGNNNDVLRIVEILKKNKTKIISITGNPVSELAGYSDVVLATVSEETGYRPEAFSSVAAQLLIVDSLFTIYAIKVDDNQEYFTKIRNIINSTRI